MNANAARLRKVLPLTAAIALLLAAVAASLSLPSASALDLSPQPALASGEKLAPQPAPERLPHPQLVPPERPAPEAPPDPAPESAPELPPGPAGQAVSESPRRDIKASGERKPQNVRLSRVSFSESSNPALDVQWNISWAGWHPDRHPYRVQYRKSGVTGWTNHSNTIRLLTARLTGLEAGATYQVRVKQNGNECQNTGITCPWSDTVSLKANSPPVAKGIYPVWNAGWPATYPPAGHVPADFYTDADGDTMTYWVSSQYPGIVTASLDDANKFFTMRALNPGSATVTYGAKDTYGGHTTVTVQVKATGKVTRSVAELSPAGTAVGNPVTGTPYDDGDDQTDDALTYTLTGEAATSGAFVIDSATGQISVKEGADLDYEDVDNRSYTGKVNWTIQDQAVAADLTINLTNVSAGKPDAPTVTRTEFSEQTAPALDVTWTAPDDNGWTISWYRLQYRKKAADGEDPAAWTLSGEVLESASARLSNLEAGATYQVQVRAGTNEEGLGPWSDSGEATANNPPNTNLSFLLDINGAWGHTFRGSSSLADFFGDPDGDTLRFSASSEYPGISKVWIGDDNILATLLVNPASSTVTYGAHDPYGGSAFRTYVATGVADETRSVAENSPAGTNVGRTVQGTPYDDGDPETDDALTHTLTWDTGHEDAEDLFDFDAATGQISVKEGASLDYESGTTSYTGKVTWNIQGQAAAADLTIEVTDEGAGKPGTPAVTRTEFTEQTAPALDITWTAAADQRVHNHRLRGPVPRQGGARTKRKTPGPTTAARCRPLTGPSTWRA